LTPRFDSLGLAESASFQTLGHDPVSSAIPVEDLDEISALVGKEEGGSTGRFDFDGITSDFGEAVEGFAHVAGMKGDVDFEVPIESKHVDFQARDLRSSANRRT